MLVKIFTGLISGIISGTGMGGGTVLILILSVFIGVNQHIAQATNIVFFVPTSVSSIIVNWKEKLIDFKIGIPIAFFGILGAVIGAKISTKMEVSKLKKYFGIFLMIIAIFEIYSIVKEYKTNKKRQNKNII